MITENTIELQRRSLSSEAGTSASVRRSVERARLRRLIGDLFLVTPLFLFLLVVFAAPIALFMYRAIDNGLLYRSFPNTHGALSAWESPAPVPEAAYQALAADLAAIADPAALAIIARNLNNFEEGYRSLLMKTANKLPSEPPQSWRDTFIAIDKRWLEDSRWAILKQDTGRLTSSFLLAALDLTRDDKGDITRVVPERRLYLPLLLRTFEISLSVAVICLLIGYPTAYVLTKLPSRLAGLLMICVLLPFWTSLLVRTTAWIILLQGNGPINSTLQLMGVIQQPLELIFNRFGTLVAMSHVLLPYMILPLYSVMKSIPESHMRAALSLGANQRTAFLRIYLPQTAPGIGAGLLLVFVLALGYYITPALVGGPRDQMLSYMITYHVNEVVNWGMAAALALLLLVATAILLLVFGRLVKLRQVIG